MQEGTLYAAKLHHRKDVWGPDAYARLPATRLRGQDKATLGSHLAALASVCLHIVFFTLDRHSSGPLKGEHGAALVRFVLLFKGKKDCGHKVHVRAHPPIQRYGKHSRAARVRPLDDGEVEIDWRAHYPSDPLK